MNYQVLFGENPSVESLNLNLWVYFFVFRLVLNIAAFKMLISVVASTHERVMLTLPAFLCRTKADFMLDQTCNYKKRDEEELLYLYVVRYADEHDDKW